ncbi:MAG: PEP-CTERM sorting domain-containing protein [Phycisphaerales bacterium]
MRFPAIEATFVAIASTCFVAHSAQAVTYYNQSAVSEAPTSTYTGFGVIQNQHDSSFFYWRAYFDDLTYTTETGTETQSFDSAVSAAAAGWTEWQSRDGANDFGYSSTNFAGGTGSGEAGGLFDRSAPRGWYADNTIGTLDMATDDFFASGTMYLDSTFADNSIYLGWNNPEQVAEPNINRLGFVLTEPNASTPPNGARIAIVVSGSGGTQTEGSMAVGDIINKPLYWELSYNATTGVFSGMIRDLADVEELQGDLNSDGFVGITDLNIVLGLWNQNVTPGAKLEGDPSGDGFVGIEDLNNVLSNWNAGTPPVSTSAPEPTSLGLLGLGGVMLLKRRR